MVYTFRFLEEKTQKTVKAIAKADAESNTSTNVEGAEQSEGESAVSSGLLIAWEIELAQHQALLESAPAESREVHLEAIATLEAALIKAPSPSVEEPIVDPNLALNP